MSDQDPTDEQLRELTMMGAPDHAEPIGDSTCKASDGRRLPDVTCDGCGWKGNAAQLLGVDPDENSTMWCPQCHSIGWVYD